MKKVGGPKKYLVKLAIVRNLVNTIIREKRFNINEIAK